MIVKPSKNTSLSDSVKVGFGSSAARLQPSHSSAAGFALMSLCLSLICDSYFMFVDAFHHSSLDRNTVGHREDSRHAERSHDRQG